MQLILQYSARTSAWNLQNGNSFSIEALDGLNHCTDFINT